MYSGQFEIRNVPVAGPSCVAVGPPVADLFSELAHAAGEEPPLARAAAAAAPPPMKRRRDVRLAARREIWRRSIASKSLEGMATVPFGGFGEGEGTDDGQRLRVVEHVFEILGRRDVGGGQHQRRC